jgi:DNA segregation ATPase FtsK/SpoIIIE-like protein
MTNQEKIEHILRSFGVIAKVQHTFDGYSSASYLLEINAGVQISSIQRYKLDIANALDVSSVRINKDLFVYNSKSYLAIESGKKNTATLSWDRTKLDGNKIPIGVDNFGQVVIWDVSNNSTPHMLICGATGSGKSVCLKSTIEYALVNGFDEIYIFDPKHEFRDYKNNHGVTVINEIEDIETQIALLVLDMEERVRRQSKKKTLVVFDEFADAVANSRKGNDLKNYGEENVGLFANGNVKTKRVVKSVDKSLEENLRILLQKGRSSGFRIIAATQRASTKVITGDAKVNFPVQVCFRVPKDIDSIVVIDEPGAEALNGRGDGLIKSPEYMGIVRFQGFYKGLVH